MAHDIYISCTETDREAAASIAEYLSLRGMKCRQSSEFRPSRAGTGPSEGEGSLFGEGGPALAEELTPEEYRAAAKAAIAESKVMVLVFSESVNDSAEILDDVTYAAEHGLTIIPYRLSDAEPTGTLGFFLKPLQWLNADEDAFDGGKAALARLCLTNVMPPEVTPSDEGPEMSLLRKKKKKRRIITGICCAAIALAAVVAAVLYSNAKAERTYVREMSCEQVFLSFTGYLEANTGTTDYQYYRSTDGDVKYAVFRLKDDGSSCLTAVVRFYDKDGGDPESGESGFYKLGLTNTIDAELVTTRAEWEPYMRAMISTLYPNYSDKKIDEVVNKLYGNLEEGNSKIITSDFIMTYVEFEPMFLFEVTMN